MKVLFIEPPGRYLRTLGSLGSHKADFLWQPFDHMLMGGYLRKELPKIDFEILDARDKNYKFVRKKVSNYNPDVVVFNTCVTSINKDLYVAKVVKEIDKNIVTIATGQVLVSLWEYSLSNNYLDYSIIDPEPEYALINLLKTSFKPKTGVAFKKNKKIIKLKPSIKIDVNKLGFPAHDKVNNNIYYDVYQKRKPFALIYGSRGCRWGKCTFCSCPLNFQPLRIRSISNIISELEWITTDFKIREIKWWDAEFNCNLIWCKKLLNEIIKRKIDITWQANFRADLWDRELLKLMKKAGCHTICIGLESTDFKILKNVNKGISPKWVEKLARESYKIGINPVIYSLFGLPGETIKTMIETGIFLRKLGFDSTYGIVVPNPGTELYEYMKNKKLIIEDDFSLFDSSSTPVFEYENLKKEEIIRVVSFLKKKHYLNPKYVLKKLVKTRTLKEIKHGINTLTMLVRK